VDLAAAESDNELLRFFAGRRFELLGAWT